MYRWFFEQLTKDRRTFKQCWAEYWCPKNHHQPKLCEQCKHDRRWVTLVGIMGTVQVGHRERDPL